MRNVRGRRARESQTGDGRLREVDAQGAQELGREGRGASTMAETLTARQRCRPQQAASKLGRVGRRRERGDVGARSRKVERGEGGPALALEQVFQLALLEKASTTIRRARPARQTLPLSRTMPPPHQRNLTLHPLPPRKRPAAGRSHVHPTRSACVRQSAPTRPFPWE